MDSIREVFTTVQKTADEYFDKASVALTKASKLSTRFYSDAKKRCTVFMETGAAHYHQAETEALEQIKDGFLWMKTNQLYGYAIIGATSIVLIPGFRRMLFRSLFRPFRSDEAIFRSAEDRLATIKSNYKTNSKQSVAITKSMETAFEEHRAACQKIKSTNASLRSLSGQIEKDLRITEDILRDMKELPSRPSLKIQSEVAVQLKQLQRYSTQVEKLQYKILQKGF